MNFKRTFIITTIALAFLFGSANAYRLPFVGGDENEWGWVLNNYSYQALGPNATTLNITQWAIINQTNVTNLTMSLLPSCDIKTDAGGKFYCGTDAIGSGGTGKQGILPLYNDSVNMYINDSYYRNNISAYFVNRTDWSTHDDYPPDCSAGYFVSGLGDSLTCNPDQNTYNTTEEMQNAVGSAFNHTLIYDDAGDSMGFNMSWGDARYLDNTDTNTEKAGFLPILYNDTVYIYFNDTYYHYNLSLSFYTQVHANNTFQKLGTDGDTGKIGISPLYNDSTNMYFNDTYYQDNLSVTFYTQTHANATFQLAGADADTGKIGISPLYNDSTYMYINWTLVVANLSTYLYGQTHANNTFLKIGDITDTSKVGITPLYNDTTNMYFNDTYYQANLSLGFYTQTHANATFQLLGTDGDTGKIGIIPLYNDSTNMYFNDTYYQANLSLSFYTQTHANATFQLAGADADTGKTGITPLYNDSTNMFFNDTYYQLNLSSTFYQQSLANTTFFKMNQTNRGYGTFRANMGNDNGVLNVISEGENDNVANFTMGGRSLYFGRYLDTYTGLLSDADIFFGKNDATKYILFQPSTTGLIYDANGIATSNWWRFNSLVNMTNELNIEGNLTVESNITQIDQTSGSQLRTYYDSGLGAWVTEVI